MKIKYLLEHDSGPYMICKYHDDFVHFALQKKGDDHIRIVLNIPRHLAPKMSELGIYGQRYYIDYSNVLPGVLESALVVCNSVSHFSDLTLLKLDFKLEALHILPEDIQLAILMNLNNLS